MWTATLLKILLTIIAWLTLSAWFVMLYVVVQVCGHKKYTGEVAGWRPEELESDDE